jgi:hypothetical protein
VTGHVCGALAETAFVCRIESVVGRGSRGAASGTGAKLTRNVTTNMSPDRLWSANIFSISSWELYIFLGQLLISRLTGQLDLAKKHFSGKRVNQDLGWQAVPNLAT